jgi:hypothetical protein
MNKITKILLGLCFVVLVLNGCGDSASPDSGKENTELSEIQNPQLENEIAHLSALPDGWSTSAVNLEDRGLGPQPKIEKIISANDINFSNFDQKPFVGADRLGLKWVISDDDISVEGAISDVVISTNKYWLLRLLIYEGLPSYSEMMYKILPETGEYKQLNNFLGPTDGEYVWSCLWWRHPYPTVCWHVDDGIIWSNNALGGEAGNTIAIVGNQMLHENSIYDHDQNTYSTYVSLFNPANGEISWRLKLENAFSWIQTGESKDRVLVRSNRAGYQEPPDYHYYVIGLESANIEKVFEEENDLRFLSYGDHLFVQKENKLLEITEELDGFDNTIQIKDGVYIESILNYKPGEKVILYTETHEDGEVSKLIIDAITGEENTVTGSDIQIFGHSLISTTENRIQALNPSTLEPTWWINLDEEELGENPRVIWCDWRGVLVMSDTKLACFDSNLKK